MNHTHTHTTQCMIQLTVIIMLKLSVGPGSLTNLHRHPPARESVVMYSISVFINISDLLGKKVHVITN